MSTAAIALTQQSLATNTFIAHTHAHTLTDTDDTLNVLEGLGLVSVFFSYFTILYYQNVDIFNNQLNSILVGIVAMLFNLSFISMWIWKIFPSTWNKLQEFRQAEHIELVTNPKYIRAIGALLPATEENDKKQIPPDSTDSGKAQRQRRVSKAYIKRTKIYNRLKALRLVRLLGGVWSVSTEDSKLLDLYCDVVFVK